MATSEGARFRALIDRLGAEIVSGERAVGSSDTVDAIVARMGASRTVVREATRVLASLGMLRASPRVGLRVRAESEWDLLDPQVIRWRLAAEGTRDAQVAELRGLRLAVEPEAARLAAAGSGDARPLVSAAGSLAFAADARDGEHFLAADRIFHQTLLTLAGNAMLSRLGAIVDEALEERTPSTSVRWAHAAADVALHREVAEAVAAGDERRAAERMRRIVDAAP